MSEWICGNCKYLLNNDIDGPCVDCGPDNYNYNANIKHVDKNVYNKLVKNGGY